MPARTRRYGFSRGRRARRPGQDRGRSDAMRALPFAAGHRGDTVQVLREVVSVLPMPCRMRAARRRPLGRTRVRQAGGAVRRVRTDACHPRLPGRAVVPALRQPVQRGMPQALRHLFCGFRKKCVLCLDINCRKVYTADTYAAVAQLVEQWTENPCVVGPIPTGGSTKKPRNARLFCFCGEHCWQDCPYSAAPPFLLRLATASFTRAISLSTPEAKAAQFSFFAICIAPR